MHLSLGCLIMLSIAACSTPVDPLATADGGAQPPSSNAGRGGSGVALGTAPNALSLNTVQLGSLVARGAPRRCSDQLGDTGALLLDSGLQVPDAEPDALLQMVAAIPVSVLETRIANVPVSPIDQADVGAGVGAVTVVLSRDTTSMSGTATSGSLWVESTPTTLIARFAELPVRSLGNDTELAPATAAIACKR